MSPALAVPTGLRRAVAVLAVLAVVGTLVTVLRSGDDDKRATVFLPRAVHLYAGSDVSVLGVRVGEVVEVRPEGDRVRVELKYDRDQPVPADAQAVLVSPTLVADRYVQLAPVYDGGPELADGATIPLDRTQVPVELDDVFSTLHDLSEALGPNGANADGALSDLVSVAADNLDGNGQAANDTLAGVADLATTLSDNREPLFATVRNLQLLTTELAERDRVVREFSGDLALVSGQLAGERERLGEALSSLAGALGKVTSFVRDNRSDLTANVENLASLAAALAAEKEQLGSVLDIAPTGIGNFSHLYNPDARALTGRINANDKYETPGYFICSLIAQVSPEACLDVLRELLGPILYEDLRPPGGVQAAQSDQPPARVSRVEDKTLAGILTGGRS